MSHKKFGELLVQGIKRFQTAKNLSMEATNQQLEAALSYSRHSIYKWRNGESLPKRQTIRTLVELFIETWQADRDWVDRFLKAADYDEAERQALCDTLFDEDMEDVGDAEPTATSSSIFNADVDVAEKIYLLTEWLMAQMAPNNLFRLSGGIMLWVMGAWFVWPFYDWPFAEGTALEICLRYAAVSSLLPPLVALLHALEDPQRQSFEIWVLRLNGAYLGYHIFLSMYFIATMVFYSIRLDMSLWVEQIIFSCILIIAYSYAYLVPAKRPLDGNKVTYHSADRDILLLIILWGPLFAAVIYMAHPYLASPMGIWMVVIAIAIFAFLRKQGIVT